MATQAVAAARKSFRELHGVVVTAGLMQKTVKVKVGGQRWNSKVKKFFDDPKTFLVHDPNDSLRAGDVVAITPGWRQSKHKRHVVKQIIAPSGTPISERPPIPTEQERWEAKEAEKAAKDQRRAARAAEGRESALKAGEEKAAKELLKRQAMEQRLRKQGSAQTQQNESASHPLDKISASDVD